VNFPDQLQALDNISNVRGMSLNGDMEAFYVFFDKLVPCVAGRKVWTVRERAAKTISEAKRIVSVLDEAFTILALENYWQRWFFGGTARWTDSRSGNYQFMGWADAAYVRFDRLCHQIREQRQTAVNKELELTFLARARSQMAGGGAPMRRGNGQQTIGVEVYNELDDDDEID
jgi:hypothetical protein